MRHDIWELQDYGSYINYYYLQQSIVPVSTRWPSESGSSSDESVENAPAPEVKYKEICEVLLSYLKFFTLQ